MQSGELRVVQPAVLDELELTAQVGVQGDELQPSLSVVGEDPPATQQPVPIGDRERGVRSGSWVEGVARVGPADVGADRAAQTADVVVVVAEVVGRGQLGAIGVRALHQRRAAAPPAHHLRGEQLGVQPQLRGGGGPRRRRRRPRPGAGCAARGRCRCGPDRRRRRDGRGPRRPAAPAAGPADRGAAAARGAGSAARTRWGSRARTRPARPAGRWCRPRWRRAPARTAGRCRPGTRTAPSRCCRGSRGRRAAPTPAARGPRVEACRRPCEQVGGRRVRDHQQVDARSWSPRPHCPVVRGVAQEAAAAGPHAGQELVAEPVGDHRRHPQRRQAGGGERDLGGHGGVALGGGRHVVHQGGQEPARRPQPAGRW